MESVFFSQVTSRSQSLKISRDVLHSALAKRCKLCANRSPAPATSSSGSVSHPSSVMCSSRQSLVVTKCHLFANVCAIAKFGT